MIITAAKTVSRASVVASALPPIMIVRISATSITVTETASTSVPKGSPTLAATISAWCTATTTVPIRPRTTTPFAQPGRCPPHVRASSTSPAGGSSSDHSGLRGPTAVMAAT